MAISNSRMTFGAVLGTVQTTAFAVSNTMQGLSNSAGMFNAAVENARHKQALRHKADQATFKKIYALEKTREIETLKQEVYEWLGNDEARKKSFAATLAEIEDALN